MDRRIEPVAERRQHVVGGCYTLCDIWMIARYPGKVKGAATPWTVKFSGCSTALKMGTKVPMPPSRQALKTDKA